MIQHLHCSKLRRYMLQQQHHHSTVLVVVVVVGVIIIQHCMIVVVVPIVTTVVEAFRVQLVEVKSTRSSSTFRSSIIHPSSSSSSSSSSLFRYTISSRWKHTMSTTSNSNDDITLNHTVPPPPPPKHVCIVGSGIIGISTAYYLVTQYNIHCTIIDRSGIIAPAASGKAGGFLAYDWNDGSVTESLTHRSFQLHEELATKFTPDSIQYRRLSCVAMNVASSSSSSSIKKASIKPTNRKLHNIEWATSNDDNIIQNVRTLGTESTIAQVHPKLLCERLWYETKQCIPTCQLLQGNVIKTLFTTEEDESDDTHHNTTKQQVCGVQLDDGTVIDADAVLYACGPWNILMKATTGTKHLETSIRGIKYHSIIVPTKKVYTQCVFFSGVHIGDPEVYVRPNHTAYCTGYPELPRIVTEIPGEEMIDETKILQIYNAIQQVVTTTTPAAATTTTTTTSTFTETKDGDENNTDIDHNVERPSLLLDNKDNIVSQACYLPSTDDGIPIMGKLHHDSDGLYIATGHSCWGILLGPGTGECMASLIATDTSTKYVNLDMYDPYRFT